MIPFAAGAADGAAAHHEPDAMHHVMDTVDWVLFESLNWTMHFEVVNVDIPFFGKTIHLQFFTKFQLLMVLAAALICLIYIPLAKKIQTGAPPKGAWWNLFESLLAFIRDNVAKPYISHHPDHYVPFLWTMFLFVLMCNLLGMFPFLGSPTSSFPMTLALATIVFVFIHASGIKENGLKGHFFAFVPHLDLPLPLKLGILAMLVPIEIAGLAIKCFVLSVRLFANMFAGHMVLATVLIFIWQARNLDAGMFSTVTIASVLGATALSMLELFVAFLQAFIFTFLTALFLGSVLHPEH